MKILVMLWGPIRPTEAIVIDSDKSHKHFVLWKKGNDKTVAEIFVEEQKLKDIVDDSDSITIIEYKKYYDYFGKCCAQELFDYQYEYDDLPDAIKMIKERKSEFGKEWQRIRADAAEVYSTIEKRGILLEYKHVFPKYSMNVYSGRSKTTGTNIQGLNSDFDVRHPDLELQYFLRFDWIAADMRMASYLSEDEELSNSFLKSDPYGNIENALDNKIDRKTCKIMLNKAVNSLNDSGLIFKVFPSFGSWIKKQKESLKRDGYVESILHRKFYTDHTLKGDRRAFNATLQGSVAHAMQSVITRVLRECGNIIVTEQHDSLTISTTEKNIKKNIEIMSDIMSKPFDNDIHMPFRVEIGKLWGVYKTVREFR